jgi:hypothetical protein
MLEIIYPWEKDKTAKNVLQGRTKMVSTETIKDITNQMGIPLKPSK